MTQNAGTSRALEVVDVPEQCGNAPRKLVICDFMVGLYGQDIELVTSLLSDNVQWDIIGAHSMASHDEVATWIMEQNPGRKLAINTVITHGPECGVDGTITYHDGTVAAFSHIMAFTGGAKTAKIKAIRSYIVPDVS